jgi:hypothetical protein
MAKISITWPSPNNWTENKLVVRPGIHPVHDLKRKKVDVDATFVTLPHDSRRGQGGGTVIDVPPMLMIRGVTIDSAAIMIIDT